MIVESKYILGAPQADGRVWCRESHLCQDGRTITAEYLAPPDWDFETTLQARAENIGAELQRRRDALAESTNFVVPWTKREFMERFTFQERIAIREARKVNSVVDDFLDFLDKSQDVTPGFGTLMSGLHYLEMLGLLAEGRADEVGRL
jgi:hypothetical protein